MAPLGTVRWLLVKAQPHVRLVTLSVAAAMIGSIVATIDPLLMRRWLDVTLPSRDLLTSLGMVLSISLCFVGRSAVGGCSSLVSFRVSQRIGLDLRTELVRHMTALSADWHERTHVGEKLSRIEQDVEQVAQFAADALNTILRSVLFFILNLVVMFSLNWRMTLTVLPLLPLFLWVRARYRNLIQLKADRTQAEVGRSSAHLAEHLGAVPQIQLLGAEELCATRAINIRDETATAQWSQRKTEIGFSVTVTAVMACAILCLLGMGTHEYLRGALSIGSLVAFYAYVTRIFEPVSSVMELYARSQRMLASTRRVREVLETEPTVQDYGTVQSVPSPLRRGLICDSVCFSYTDAEQSLHDVSLSIRPGERLAIVGRSGSGKSTLARLLARVADPTKGEIALEAIPLREYRLSALRASLCYVPQYPALFSGTVRDNLLYAAPSATETQLETAIEAAQLKGVIQRLPEGLTTALGPEAARLSGGERQRLALARALLRNASILVLDEATSALDVPTENAVLRSIADTGGAQTVVIISHRLHSLMWVDRLVLLDGGQIVAEGRHRDLYRDSNLYRELFDKADETSLDSPGIGGQLRLSEI
ncbi:ABC transporter ATP-binding protein [Acidicapsa ligni]|uniref:ABC transporter ATP-binding protein n=1 Tax=Acidicapsa ligni TaxID=542300 RepID=UPI0021E03709|nr:ABC transporter ATP-binding protein [Acidicapsa ligni]